MTPLTVNEWERQHLASVASEYESQGYDVTVQPPSADLPDFLAGFEPDLIATGKGETVVVEVKARNNLKDGRAIAALENALRNQPGWRFELIIDGPAPENRQTLGATQIREAFEEAEDLQQRDHLVPALLLLWSATEGALRLLAIREDVELESLAPGYVVTRLYTLGLLGREQYQVLEETIKLCNQAAHGFQVSVTRQDLTSILAISRELLSELEVRAA